MIIVLNNADFSQKNLGNIPLNKELSPLAKTAMENLTRFPAEKTNLYAQALNTMLQELNDVGIINKLKVLSIPYMANSIEECSYNIVGASGNQITAIYELTSSNEIKQKVLGAMVVSGGYAINQMADDICMFGLFNLGDKYNICGCSEKQVTNYFNYSNRCYTNGTQTQLILGKASMQIAGSLPLARTIPSGAVVMSYKNGVVSYKDAESFITGQPITPPTSIETGVFYPISAYSNETSDSLLSTSGLYGCGSGLTAQETKALYDILVKFKSAFKN